MAEITQRPPVINLEITLKISEPEARALLALTVYGTDSFLEMFYKYLGKSELSPYEQGLKTFFSTYKELCPPILKRLNTAREVFNSSATAK